MYADVCACVCVCMCVQVVLVGSNDAETLTASKCDLVVPGASKMQCIITMVSLSSAELMSLTAMSVNGTLLSRANLKKVLKSGDKIEMKNGLIYLYTAAEMSPSPS
jgi:hypothetical protein